MLRIKHRTLLRGKDVRELLNHLKDTPILLHRTLSEQDKGKVPVERIVLEDKTEVFLVQDRFWLILTKEMTYPALPALLDQGVTLPEVVVDMGAVPHIANGADVMAPGIVEFDKRLSKGDLVVVIDERNRTPLAVGQMLMSAQELQRVGKGRAIQTLHYVGDRLWNLMKRLSE